MTHGCVLRLIFLLLAGLPAFARAVDRIDIHVGQVRYAGSQVENIHVTLDMNGRWQGQAALRQADLAVMAKAYSLPLDVSQGQADGQAIFSGNDLNVARLKADLALRDVAFSNAEGSRAGERVGGRLNVDLNRSGRGWDWSGALDWNAGEIYWQPWYLAKGGLSFQGKGSLSDTLLTLERGRLSVAGVGDAVLAATVRRSDNTIQNLDLDARKLDAANAYSVLLKPVMEKTLLGNLEMAGRMDVKAQLQEGALSAFDVSLQDFDVADRDNRFALYKVSAHVPWSLNQPTQANLHYDGGHLLSMPLGATDLAGVLNGYSLTSPSLRIPVLDGALTLKDVSAAFVQGQWHWHLSAGLTPLSMADFSHAVGWPLMQGKVAASIPMVTYTNGRLTADGAMGFDVFDGSVVVRNLVLQNPMSVAPRLQADIQMRNLDLELLTRTYSFGAMTGRLDGDVKNMELSRWQPVKFDADFHSSPGNYPRKISQRAVENISALGGAGAAAAIQRSFLRFFKEFNYARIGLSCTLRNGVCDMDGVEKAQSGYVIVKGSGIPAITVLGYNRSVSWGELLDRIKRITAGNASPVIK